MSQVGSGAASLNQHGTPTADRRWLTRNLKVMSLVSLLQDMASELLYPVLPILLVTVLGAPMAAVGLIEGLADGLASITKLIAGNLADRGDRKRLVGVGYGLAAAAKVVVALAWAWPVVLAARSVDRIGKGIRGTPRDAIIADGVEPADRGKAFGFHRMADTTGAVFGPLIGLGLYWALDHRIRPLLWVAAIPAVLSVLAVGWVVDQRPAEVVGAAFQEGARPASRLAGLRGLVSFDGIEPRFRRLLIVVGLFALINFPDALLLLRARSMGLGVGSVIGVYCLYSLVYAVGSYPAGAVSDRIPRRLLVGIGFMVFGVAYCGLGLASTSAAAWILIPLYGAYAALTDGVMKAWVVDLVPSEMRGRAIGLHGMVSGLGVVVAGLWAGLAWGSGGAMPLVVSGCVAAVMGVVVLLSRSLDVRQG